MNIPPKTRLVQTPDAPSAVLEKGRVFLDIESGDYMSLEGPGLAIWEALEEPMEVEQLVERLCARYNVDPERCARDTMPFLHDMLASGLIREVPPETVP